MQASPTPSPATQLRVLRVDASARAEGSVSRRLADQMLDELGKRLSGATWRRVCLWSTLPGSMPT